MTRLRVVLAGYDDHWTAPPGWSVASVRSRGGLQTGKRQGTERLWLSPACAAAAQQPALFGVAR